MRVRVGKKATSRVKGHRIAATRPEYDYIVFLGEKDPIPSYPWIGFGMWADPASRTLYLLI